MIGSAARVAEQVLILRISGRVPADVTRRMLALIARRPGSGDDEDSDEAEDAESPLSADDGQSASAAEIALQSADLFAVIREEPGNVSVTTMRREV